MLVSLLLVTLFAYCKSVLADPIPGPDIIAPANFTSYPSGATIGFTIINLEAATTYQLKLYDFDDAQSGEYFAIQSFLTGVSTTVYTTLTVPSLFSGNCAVNLQKMSASGPPPPPVAFVQLTIYQTLEALSPQGNIIYTAGQNITLNALGRGQTGIVYNDQASPTDSYISTTGYFDCPALGYSQVPMTLVFDPRYNGFTSRNPDDLTLPLQIETPNLAIFNVTVTFAVGTSTTTVTNITLLPQYSEHVPGLPSS
jgi:hypothetical protein